MFVSGPECHRLVVFRRVSETFFLPCSSPQAEAHADFLSFRSSVYNGLAKVMPSFLNPNPPKILVIFLNAWFS